MIDRKPAYNISGILDDFFLTPEERHELRLRREEEKVVSVLRESGGKIRFAGLYSDGDCNEIFGFSWKQTKEIVRRLARKKIARYTSIMGNSELDSFRTIFFPPAFRAALSRPEISE